MAKFNDPRIYLKDSDRVRLADYRARIVREIDPREPCDNEDLVFEKAEDESLIPVNALHKWKFDCNYEHEPIWFYTTAERCKQMVSDDPSYWTKEKLIEFEKIEHRLYQDWWDGHVYGYIIEKWDEKRREWTQISSHWGMYGEKDLYDNLGNTIDLFYDEVGRVNIPICLDDEEMKYDFDNTEKKVNEFYDSTPKRTTMNKTYHFEIPNIGCELFASDEYGTIEECVAACKVACAEWGVNYDDRDVKLFMTDADGKWEVTEEGELAG